MARDKVLEVGAINVVCHPHPEGVYERLLRDIRKRARVRKIYGDRWGVVNQLWGSGEGDIPLHGTVSTFVQFDPAEPWYNEQTADEATPDDVGEVEIPDYLHPSLRRCGFVFDVSTHTFIFETIPRKGGIAPRLMLSFLDQLVSDQKIMDKYGVVKLTLIPDQAVVDEILNWSALRQLFIHAELPNPGDYDESEYEEFEEWLTEQGADTLEESLRSSDGSIEPNSETRTLANIAADNGYVVGRGRDPEGRMTERSTKSEKPLSATKRFNPNLVDEQTALIQLAQEVAGNIRSRRRARRDSPSRRKRT